VGYSFLSKETTRSQGLGVEPLTFSSGVQRANHYTTVVLFLFLFSFILCVCLLFCFAFFFSFLIKEARVRALEISVTQHEGKVCLLGCLLLYRWSHDLT